MFNAQGRLVVTRELAGGVTAVKMTSLPHGMYIGRITNDGVHFTQKLVW